MKTIVFANQKGGVGKTTLSIELYRNLSFDGFAVSYYNLDNQGGGLNDIKADDPDYVIVDTPGSMTEEFRENCRNADVVLIPCRPSPNDIEPTERCWNIAKDACEDVYLIVNEYDGRNVLDQDFIEYVAGTDMRLLCKIPHSTKFSQAAARETSVTKMPNKSAAAAEAVRKMTDKVKEVCNG